jgi:CRP-like cAMP-binding protein
MDHVLDLGNRLLSALPDDVLGRLRPKLSRVALPVGRVLYESGEKLRHVFFPTSALVSLLCESGDGFSIETAIIGNEGVVGVAAFMGGESTLGRAVVLSAGQGLQLDVQVLGREFAQAGALMHLLLRYTQALLTQTAQTAACKRLHTVDQQLCRWMLQRLDHRPSEEIVMTQDVIATMLGVRRERVTEAAHKLQQAGLIDYSRGHIVVIDRGGLQACACECYAVVKREYDRLLTQALAAGADTKGPQRQTIAA